MKDAVERITAKGNSVLLFQLANRIGYHTCNERETTKTNIIAMTTIGVKEGEKMRVIEEGESKTLEEESSQSLEEESSQSLEEENMLVISSDDMLFDTDNTRDVIQMNDGLCNDSDIVNWRLNAYPQLRELVVGDNCLKYVKGLQLRSMKMLESVEIGENCFTESETVLEVSGCKMLEQLSIGAGSFLKLKELKLNRLESLERVEIGEECFTENNGCFEICGCKKLESVKMGSGSCVKWSSFVMRDCGVEEVSIGNDCFVSCVRVVFESVLDGMW